MIPIVTQCDETFWPGLKALYNSYLRHSREGFDFYAMLCGSPGFIDRAERLGINVLYDPEIPRFQLPTSGYYPTANGVMYKVLALPYLFPHHDKAIYIDTDSLILRNLMPLVELDIGDKMLAAMRCNAPREKNYKPCPPSHVGTYGPMTSLIVYNLAAMRAKGFVQKFVETAQLDGIEWTMIGQGIIHYFIGDDWYELPYHTQAHAGHATYFTAPKDEIYSLHFMGTKPWREFSDPGMITERKMETRRLWRDYANG